MKRPDRLRYRKSCAPIDVMSVAIAAAASAPSCEHAAVVRDCELKRRIRVAAEEEKINYTGRMPKEWLDALAPLQTDWHKEFLEIAPALIVVFKEDYGFRDSRKVHHYYVERAGRYRLRISSRSAAHRWTAAACPIARGSCSEK